MRDVFVFRSTDEERDRLWEEDQKRLRQELEEDDDVEEAGDDEMRQEEMRQLREQQPGFSFLSNSYSEVSDEEDETKMLSDVEEDKMEDELESDGEEYKTLMQEVQDVLANDNTTEAENSVVSAAAGVFPPRKRTKTVLSSDDSQKAEQDPFATLTEDEKKKALSKVITDLEKVEARMRAEKKNIHYETFERKWINLDRRTAFMGEAPEGYDKQWWNLQKDLKWLTKKSRK